MSSNRRKTTKNFKKNHPIKMGQFYKVSDSKTGHPAQVFFLNPGGDLYLVIKFSTKRRKDRIKLKHSIDPNSSHDQYIQKRPFEVNYDELNYNEKYLCFRIHPDDQELIEKIKTREPHKHKKR